MNRWALLPLQRATWMTVPLAVEPHAASRQKPPVRMVPSDLIVHCCWLEPLQLHTCTGAPSRAAACRHLPDSWPTIGRPLGAAGDGDGGG
ncbi:hypothetical protein GCM10009661_48900 [Catellatospora chokoriensis]